MELQQFNNGEALSSVRSKINANFGKVQDFLPYKKIVVDLAISDGTVTPTYLYDDFPDETKNWTNPSNGILRLTGDAESTWNVANNTRVVPFVIDNSGTPYFGTGGYELIGFPTYWLDIRLRKFDGTQTSTPSVTILGVEIRVYP